MVLSYQVIDFVDDIHRTLLKEAGAKAPEHIKEAKILTAEERETLSADQFALVMRTKEAQVLKKFPITDQANTWLSCQYFEKTSEQLPFVAQKIAASNLRKACLVYGLDIPGSVDKLASTEIQDNRYDEVKHWMEDKRHTKTAKISQAEPDGSEHFYALAGRYAMPNQEYVKKAAAYFDDHLREFSDAEDRFTFASNVRARAEELQVQLEKRAEESIKTYSSDSYGDSVETQLRLRQELLHTKPELSSALSKLASHKKDTNPEVFAKALFLFDKKAGLTRYYDGFLADAFKATFGKLQSKTASSYRWEDDQSGLSIDEVSLTKAATDKYERIKAYFGASVADQLKKHAVSIFESLPKDAKETVVKISKGDL